MVTAVVCSIGIGEFCEHPDLSGCGRVHTFAHLDGYVGWECIMV